jgi:hypothetical protein
MGAALGLHNRHVRYDTTTWTAQIDQVSQTETWYGRRFSCKCRVASSICVKHHSGHEQQAQNCGSVQAASQLSRHNRLRRSPAAPVRQSSAGTDLCSLLG